MSEDDGPVRAALDEQLAVVGRAMMGLAQRQEIADDVQTAVGSALNVVDIDEDRVRAAGNLAAVPIAVEHGSA